MSADVSVIIPSYNRRAMLHEAVASVLAQRGASFELIVMDDGSTDGTSDDIRAMTRGLDVQVTIERVARRGVAAARNRGAALARAPQIAFLDSDDLWMPSKLARQLEFARAHPEFEISQCQERWIRGGARVNPGARHRKRAGDIFIDSLSTCLISPSSVMIKTALFRASGGFDESLLAAEDYDLWLRILLDHEAGLLDEVLVERRASDPGHASAGQLSSTVPAIDRFRILALAKLLSDPRLADGRRFAAARVLAHKCEIYAGGLRRRGRIDEAAPYERARELGLGAWQSNPGQHHELLAAIRNSLTAPCELCP